MQLRAGAQSSAPKQSQFHKMKMTLAILLAAFFPSFLIIDESAAASGDVMMTIRTATGFATVAVPKPASGTHAITINSSAVLGTQVAGNAVTTAGLSQFPNNSTSSAQLLALLNNETGTGSAVFSISPAIQTPSISGAVSWQANQRQTFTPGVDVAGVNVGAVAVTPGSPLNGDLWYDSATEKLMGYINGAAVDLMSAGAGALTGTTLAANVVSSSLASVGTLTGGATGAGFTVALSTANITGTLAAARLPAFSGGDVTSSAGSAVLSIGAAKITNAMIQNGVIAEAKLNLQNNTDGDVSVARHGFAPLLPNDATRFLDGTGNYSVPVGGAILRGHLSGFQLGNNSGDPNDDIDVGVGQAADYDQTEYMAGGLWIAELDQVFDPMAPTYGVIQSADLAGTVTTVGTTAVVGTGTAFLTDFSAGDVIYTAGGFGRRITVVTNNTSMTTESAMGTETTVTYRRGGEAPSTWYHVVIISDGSNVYPALTTRVDASDRDAGTYPAYRRIGSIYNTSGGTVKPFTNAGRFFRWTTFTKDHDADISTSRTNVTLSVPTGVKVMAKIRITQSGADSTTTLVTQLNETDSAAVNTFNNAISGDINGSNAARGEMELVTDTSGRIGIRASAASTSVAVYTRGWTEIDE